MDNFPLNGLSIFRTSGDGRQKNVRSRLISLGFVSPHLSHPLVGEQAYKGVGAALSGWVSERLDLAWAFPVLAAALLPAVLAMAVLVLVVSRRPNA